MKFKEIREKIGFTQQEFSAYFEIPTRTYQKWEYYEDGKTAQGRKPPEYIKKMMLKILNNSEDFDFSEF